MQQQTLYQSDILNMREECGHLQNVCKCCLFPWNKNLQSDSVSWIRLQGRFGRAKRPLVL